jgi:hypothetical protein
MMKNIFGLIEMERIWLFLIFVFLLKINYVKSASSSSNQWIVYDLNHSPCIRMEATIDLNLTYLVGDPDIYRSVAISVPSALTVNNDLSSCSRQIISESKTIDSQVLHLDFPHDPQWLGWSIEFWFSQSQYFHASSNEFTLYGVKVIANYSSQEKLFAGHRETSHTYTQAIYFDHTSPSEIADNIYANKHYSYFCSSASEYPINNDETYGLKAWIKLRKVRVQAYAPSGNTKFGDREICPQDQTSGDLIPVIVGGVLAGLVVITLIIYLVYRARQPPSVLYLTNPHSHFEDIGTNFKHNHESIEEDEDDERSAGVGSQRRVARHLQEHSNLAYEE